MIFTEHFKTYLKNIWHVGTYYFPGKNLGLPLSAQVIEYQMNGASGPKKMPIENIASENITQFPTIWMKKKHPILFRNYKTPGAPV